MNKENLKLVLTFVLITTFSTIIVSIVYFLTAPVIENNILIRENQIIVSMFPNTEIEDVENNLVLNIEKERIDDVLKVENKYIYKAKSNDLFSGDETKFLVIIEDDEFKEFQIIDSEDDYVSFFNTEEFKSRFLNKDYNITFDGSDLSTSATLSANPIAETIIVIGNHYGRNFRWN